MPRAASPAAHRAAVVGDVVFEAPVLVDAEAEDDAAAGLDVVPIVHADVLDRVLLAVEPPRTAERALRIVTRCATNTFAII